MLNSNEDLEIASSLSEHELEQINAILMMPSPIKRVFLTKEATIKELKVVKYALELSGFQKDKQVLKFVTSEYILKSKDELFNLPLKNVDTWFVSIKTLKHEFFTNISNWKKIYQQANAFKREASFLSKLKVFNYVKSFSFKEGVLLEDSFIFKKGTSFQFNEVFSYYLKELGFQTGVFETERGWVTGVFNDGLYFFDPFRDRSSDLEKYNYFFLTTEELFKVDTLKGDFKYLGYQSFDKSLISFKNEKLIEELFALKEKTKVFNKINLIKLIYDNIDIEEKDKKEYIQKVIENIRE